MRDNTFTPGPWYAVKDAVIAYNKEKWQTNGLEKIAEVSSDHDGNIIASAPDLYNALWEAVELSDRTLPDSGRTAECQRVYDLCVAALKKAEGDA